MDKKDITLAIPHLQVRNLAFLFMPRKSVESADASDFGKRLRKCRLAVGMTLDRLAELTGMAANRLSTLETSPNSNPKLDTIYKLAAALGISAARLISDE